MEQAKLGDQVACPCKGGPHRIVSAASTTFVDGVPAARVGDRSSCGASIVTGLDWYTIEGAAAAIHGSQTSCGGTVIAASSAVTGQPSGGASASSLLGIQPPRYNRRVVLRDEYGSPLANQPYRLVLESGETKEGKTNAEGEADLMDSELAAKLEAIERWQREGESLNIVQRLAREVARPNFMQIEMQLKTAALGRWAWLTMPGGVWDHKQYFDPKVDPELARRFATLGITTEQFHHKYQGYEYFYDIWSNIHYGYVGRDIGFAEDTLLDGAGLAQYGSDLTELKWPENRSDTNGEGFRRFDDVTDYLSVRLGISLFERFSPQQLTGSVLMDEITQVDYPEYLGSKIKHTCQGVRNRCENPENRGNEKCAGQKL